MGDSSAILLDFLPLIRRENRGKPVEPTARRVFCCANAHASLRLCVISQFRLTFPQENSLNSNVVRLRRWLYNRSMATGPFFNERRDLRLPQFRLRTLMWFVALLAVLFAVMGVIGPLASTGLLMFLVLIGLHVAGNAVGTTLRDSAPRRSVDPAPAKFRNPYRRRFGLNCRLRVCISERLSAGSFGRPRLLARAAASGSE